MSELYNYRQVALKLHALHAEDRRWLLSQLASQQRLRLQQLLEELDELGIIHTQHLAEQTAICPTGKFELTPGSVSIIDAAPVEAILNIFATLPERLKAMLLHCYTWQWGPRLWNQMESPECARILRQIAQLPHIKHATYSALVDALAEMLRDHSNPVQRCE